MQISKKIEINNNIYYIIVDVEYKKDNYDYPILCLKNYEGDDCWDGGNCSVLIDEIEKSYTKEKAALYDENIFFMADVLYIYDRMPFISGIKEIYLHENEKVPYSEYYISKEEIETYIKRFNIKMNHNPDFTLNSQSTWKV